VECDGDGEWRFGGGVRNPIHHVIDIYAAANKQLLWTGRGTKSLNLSKNQQKNMENLNKAIAKIMKNYPPPAK
jgi:hypothetical protein